MLNVGLNLKKTINITSYREKILEIEDYITLSNNNVLIKFSMIDCFGLFGYAEILIFDKHRDDLYVTEPTEYGYTCIESNGSI